MDGRRWYPYQHPPPPPTTTRSVCNPATVQHIHHHYHFYGISSPPTTATQPCLSNPHAHTGYHYPCSHPTRPCRTASPVPVEVQQFRHGRYLLDPLTLFLLSERRHQNQNQTQTQQPAERNWQTEEIETRRGRQRLTLAQEAEQIFNELETTNEFFRSSLDRINSQEGTRVINNPVFVQNGEEVQRLVTEVQELLARETEAFKGIAKWRERVSDVTWDRLIEADTLTTLEFEVLTGFNTAPFLDRLKTQKTRYESIRDNRSTESERSKRLFLTALKRELQGRVRRLKTGLATLITIFGD